MTLKLYEDAVEISVTDEGKGIEDIEKGPAAYVYFQA